MQVETSIFKAYDIRGTYPDQLSVEVAYAIGRALATLLLKENPGAALTVAVGSDMRLSGPVLKPEVIRGIRETGVNVVDIGLVSTPTFYYAVAKHGYHGGVQVSASHNPSHWSGMKMVRAGGVPIAGASGIETMRGWIERDELAPKAAQPGGLSEQSGTTEEEAAEVAAMVPASSIRPMKIVVDTANAMGGPDLAALFEHLPQLSVTWLNRELDGTFPAHEADPFKEENMAQLHERIVAEGADLGIAVDGDGDRIFFADETGKTIHPAILRGVLAKIELTERPGTTVAYDIRPGRITRDIIDELGGTAIVTKVGHSLIKEAMIAHGATFGGESSGHFFYKLPYGSFEVPMLVTLKLLGYISQQGKPASQIFAPFDRYFHSGEVNTHLPSREMASAKLEELKRRYADGKLNELDGISIAYPDYWFNVRASNTEPVLRLTVEARTKELMEQKRDEISAIIKG